jgi:hypothetical protein
MEAGKQDNRENIEIRKDLQNPAPEGKEGRKNDFDSKHDDDIQPETVPPGFIFHDTTFA